MFLCKDCADLQLKRSLVSNNPAVSTYHLYASVPSESFTPHYNALCFMGKNSSFDSIYLLDIKGTGRSELLHRREKDILNQTYKTISRKEWGKKPKFFKEN